MLSARINRNNRSITGDDFALIRAIAGAEQAMGPRAIPDGGSAPGLEALGPSGLGDGVEERAPDPAAPGVGIRRNRELRGRVAADERDARNRRKTAVANRGRERRKWAGKQALREGAESALSGRPSRRRQTSRSATAINRGKHFAETQDEAFKGRVADSTNSSLPESPCLLKPTCRRFRSPARARRAKRASSRCTAGRVRG